MEGKIFTRAWTWCGIYRAKEHDFYINPNSWIPKTSCVVCYMSCYWFGWRTCCLGQNEKLKITTHKKLYSYLVRHGRGATKPIPYDVFRKEKIRATNEIITTFLLSSPNESDKKNKESKLRLQLIVSTVYNLTAKMIHKHSLRTIVHIFGILS